METPLNNPSPLQKGTSTILVSEQPTHRKRNVYPSVRHTFLIISILCALSIIIFLMYQNGKIIYDNGI
jgi:hypothetical protein